MEDLPAVSIEHTDAPRFDDESLPMGFHDYGNGWECEICKWFELWIIMNCGSKKWDEDRSCEWRWIHTEDAALKAIETRLLKRYCSCKTDPNSIWGLEQQPLFRLKSCSCKPIWFGVWSKRHCVSLDEKAWKATFWLWRSRVAYSVE